MNPGGAGECGAGFTSQGSGGGGGGYGKVIMVTLR